MREQPAVTVVVLNWNGRSFLPACLAALQAQTYPQFHILLVDNGSTDESVDFVQQAFPAVSVTETGENLGYSGGNNVGLAQINTPFALVINPDVVLPPNWLRHMMLVMQADDQIGIVGSKLVYPDRERVQHLGGFLREPLAMAADWRSESPESWPKTAVYDVDYVIGAAFLLRKELIERIGSFDADYFLYYEDTDLCWRARRAGFRVVVASQITAVHDESATTPKDLQLYLTRFHISRHRFLLKHWLFEPLLSTVYPAEKLLHHPPHPRLLRALAASYQATVKQLDFILQARVRDGGEALSLEQASQIRAALLALNASARQALSVHEALSPLQLMPPRFHSTVPMVGRLIVWLRSTWNSVATKWYVQPIVEQQNELNLLVVQRLAELEWQTRQQDAELTAVQAQIPQLQSQLKQLNSRAAAIDMRLKNLS